MSAGFWKPGTEAPISLEDRSESQDGGGGGGDVVVWNPSGNLSIDRQRQSLTVFQHRVQLLYAIEQNRVTIVVGTTGSGKVGEDGWTD